MASCVLPSDPTATGGLRHLRRLVKLEVVDYPADVERPRVRGECAPGGHLHVRPCPWVSCRMHLAMEVTRKGNVKVDRRFDEGAMPETCALDVAERGEHTLEEIGAIVGFTRERVRQVQETALAKADGDVDFGEEPGHVVPLPGKWRSA